jgi:PAS domain S-box-containing protein
VVFDAQNGLLTALLRDESEQVRLEQQRDTALGELERTFELAAVGLAHVGIDGRMQRVNRYFCELLQYSPEALTALRFQDFTHPDDLAQDLQLVQDLLDGVRQDYTMEKRYLRKDGAIVWVSLAVALARDANGQPKHFISVVHDLTLRRRAESELVEAAASERANKAKTQFLGRMSHELRTPLNAVIGFTQLLQLNDGHNLLPQQLERLGHVRTAADHMLELIEEVLDINRAEADELSLDLRREALDSIVNDARALVDDSAAKAGVRLTLALSPMASQVQVLTDRRRLMQALLNLLSNAIKYNRPGGSVDVGVDLEPDHIAIHVRDTGPGLSGEQIAHLFEPFNRLGAERTGVSGTGLGLVITRRLVEALGGKLRVKSALGEGSCFTIALRRVENAPAAPTQA